MFAGRDGGTMNARTPSLGKGFCLMVVALLTLACTQPQSSDPQPPAMRIIIKFADRSGSPPGAFQASMPPEAPVILRHERAMSGGAHLYNGRMTDEQRVIIIRELNQRPDVEYAEADRRLSY